MNLLVQTIFIFAGLAAVYALVVFFLTLKAIKDRRYEAYRSKRADFHRLDSEVRRAFEDSNQ